MKTYWDLTEQERAALTGEEVGRFGDAELMTKGVLKATPPDLEPEPALPEGDVDVFSVACSVGRLDVLFSTVEAARAFVALKPLARPYHYLNGEFVYYVDPDAEWKISAERALSKNTADLRRGEFAIAKDIRARNAKKKEDYETALKAQQEALADMWSDWRDCGLKANRMQKIARTLESYQQIADGDATVAFRFLRKVFNDEQLTEAADWGCITIPGDFFPSGNGSLSEHTAVAAAPRESTSEMAF